MDVQTLLSAADPEFAWRTVPQQVRALVKEASPLGKRLYKKLRLLRRAHCPSDPGYGHVSFNPRTGAVNFSLSDGDEQFTYDAWTSALESVKGVTTVKGEAEYLPRGAGKGGPWVVIKSAFDLPDFNKVRTYLGPAAQAIGLVPGKIFGSGQSPLVSTLAGAALTGALGYGGGALAENLLPDRFQKGRLRKTLGIAGAALGGVPGVMQGIDNFSQGRAPWEGWPPPPKMSSDAWFVKLTDELGYEPVKEAFLSAGADFVPSIPVDQFNRVVWGDPYTPMALRAATAGLIDAASMVRNDSPWVSPSDIARIAAGASSGYTMGTMAGRALGALAGLDRQTQKDLQSAGLWAGVIKGVVPMVFGH